MRLSFAALAVFLLASPIAAQQQRPILDASITVVDTGRGAPIVALHGGPGDNHRNFVPQLLDLAKTNRVVLYDQINAGTSTGPGPTSVDREVQLLRALLDSLRLDRVTLLGHSWGSILALTFADRHPERVERLVLTGSIGSRSAFYQRFAMRLQERMTPAALQRLGALQQAGVTDPGKYLEVYLPFYFADTANVRRMTPTTINFTVNREIIPDMLRTFDVTPRAARFTMPILVLQGERDLLGPADMTEAFAGFPKVRVEGVAGAGHWPFVEAPKVFLDAVRGFVR